MRWTAASNHNPSRTMKAVRFSVNQAIGNNKTALPSRRKGKQRRKKMDLSGEKELLILL